MLIGLDFDNTIANYDQAFSYAAKQFDFLPEESVGSKIQVKKNLQMQDEGMAKWQTLQGYVYGTGISSALLYEGCFDFLCRAKTLEHKVIIISHKTKFGHFDPKRVNLRKAALEWMQDHDFFSKNGASLCERDVHFASTRDEKIEHIIHFKPDIFIDDLVEVLDHKNFPHSNTKAILFSNTTQKKEQTYSVCSSWSEIYDKVLT